MPDCEHDSYTREELEADPELVREFLDRNGVPDNPWYGACRLCGKFFPIQPPE